jgi:hypothetical protein
LGTHWKLETQVENSLGTHWEQKIQKFNTHPTSPEKENKKNKNGFSGSMLQFLIWLAKFLFPTVFVTYLAYRNGRGMNCGVQ